MEPTDFKNLIVENIPPALFEDTEVAEVKQPRNSKLIKMHYRVRYLLDFDLKIRSGQV